MALHCDMLAYDSLDFGRASARSKAPSLEFVALEKSVFSLRFGSIPHLFGADQGG